MAWYPISHTVPQYVDGNGDPYSGAVLKAYSDGTSTAINFAIDSLGNATAATITLNASGYPTVSGNVVIPYLEEKYKLSLYPTQAAADANTGAIWTIDGIPISGDFGSATQTISTTTALDSADNFNHIEASGTITITEPDVDAVGAGFVHTIRNAGTGTVTLEGDGAETINGNLTEVLAPADSALLISDADNFYALISRAAHGAKGSDIASATTTEIWQSKGELIHITGTTTITSLGTASRAGEVRVLIFDGALTLTNGANLVLPGGANITTAANDIAIVYADTTTRHYVISYTLAAGGSAGILPVANGGTGQSSYTDGQLLIGNTSDNGLDKATLTAGTGIAITNGNGSITVAASSAATSGQAKAWVSYDGITNSIYDSYNVSSVTDNGTGDYTINFSNAFSNANYNWSSNCAAGGVSQHLYGVTAMDSAGTYYSKTTSSMRVKMLAGGNGASADIGDTQVSFHGDA